MLTGQYCDAKIYVVGWVELAHIVAIASGPSRLHLIYLPNVTR